MTNASSCRYFFFVLAIYVLTAAETLQIAIYEYDVCLYYYTVATVAVLLPLAQLRSMHAIAYAGVLSSLAVFLAVGLCLADSLRGFEGVAPSVLELGNSSFFNTFSAITCEWRGHGAPARVPQGLTNLLQSHLLRLRRTRHL